MKNMILHHPLRVLIIGNIVFPLLVVICFRFINLPLFTQSIIAHLAVGLIFIANAIVVWRCKPLRLLGMVAILLNFIVYILIGDISFITALPVLIGYL